MHFKRSLHNIVEAATRGALRKKLFLEISKKFKEGKDLCQSLLFNKVAGLSPATLLTKELWHSCCFPVNFSKFLRTSF